MRISSRARCMPRQTCTPCPQPMFGLGLPEDVELVGIGEAVLLPVRRTRASASPTSPAGMGTPPSSVSRVATRVMVSSGGIPPHRFLDRLRQQRAVGADRVELVGSVQQAEEQVAQRPVGGLDAGGQQQPQEREDLLVGELLTVDLGLSEAADQVVAWVRRGGRRGSVRSSPHSACEAARPRSGLKMKLSSEIDQRWNCG